jgi:hypothetical protein
MYTPKHIAEAMAELFDDPKWEGGMGATTIAWRNLWDQVASETGLSEEALMQLMKEGFLLRMERIPTMTTTRSDGWRPPVPIDDDHGWAKGPHLCRQISSRSRMGRRRDWCGHGAVRTCHRCPLPTT